MTPQEYAQLKLTILTVLVGRGHYDQDLAEKWFQWVIKHPAAVQGRVETPGVNWHEPAPHLKHARDTPIAGGHL